MIQHSPVPMHSSGQADELGQQRPRVIIWAFRKQKAGREETGMLKSFMRSEKPVVGRTNGQVWAEPHLVALTSASLLVPGSQAIRSVSAIFFLMNGSNALLEGHSFFSHTPIWGWLTNYRDVFLSSRIRWQHVRILVSALFQVHTCLLMCREQSKEAL